MAVMSTLRLKVFLGIGIFFLFSGDGFMLIYRRFSALARTRATTEWRCKNCHYSPKKHAPGIIAPDDAKVL